jgi:regulator of protease activity HflC (stomatin/prohibitin superfamily)
MLYAIGAMIIIGVILWIIYAWLSEDIKLGIKSIVGITVLLLIALFTIFCIRVVDIGEVGIKVRFGQIVSSNLQPGIQIKSPLTSLKKFNVQIQREDIKANAASKDMQDIVAEIALNYSLLPENVPSLYRNVGNNYVTVIIRPICNETIKSVTSQYSADEIITQRAEIATKMKKEIQDRLSQYGIEVNEINIINLNFSEAFNNAIELKQIAQQEALKAQQDLERVKFEAEQRITQARADAESYKLKNQEITDKTLQMAFLEKWDGKLPTISGTNGMIFDISKFTN